MAHALTVKQAGVTPWRAYGALALGVMCIAWSAIFVKWAGVSGPASAFYRVAIAAVVLVPWWLWQRPTTISRRSLGWMSVAGVAFAFDLLLWNTAIMLTTAGTATLLGASAPIWVGLGAVLVFRERLPRLFWIGMAVALIGAAFIIGRDLLQAPQLGWGHLMALIASASYAVYMLITQRVRSYFDTLSSATISVVVGGIVLWIACLALGVPLTGYSTQSWIALIGLALVSQVGGWLAINYALGHLRATITSVTLLFQPVLTALIAIPLLHEYLRPEQTIGAALVLAGVYIVHYRRTARESV